MLSLFPLVAADRLTFECEIFVVPVHVGHEDDEAPFFLWQ
jgi:hypothetical protein